MTNGVLHVELEQAREACHAALEAFVAAVTAMDDDALLATSRCRGWTVADVITHVHLGLQEMFLGIVATTAAAPTTDAAGYWTEEPPSNDPDADALAAGRFVRLLSSAYRSPKGLVGHFLPTARGILRATADLNAPAVAFQGHVLSSGDFLATWATELAVHHLDMMLELDIPGPPASALRLARDTAETLGGPLPASWPDDQATLLAWGRVPATDQQRSEAGSVRLPVLGG